MIPIRNIYYMLSYAFKALSWGSYQNLSEEEFDNIDDLYAEILIRGLQYQIKRGIQCEYIETTENLAGIRGKIDVSETIKTQAIIKRRAICSFDEFSINSHMNRVIKTALATLYRRMLREKTHWTELDLAMRQEKRERLRQIYRLLCLLHEVDEVDIHKISWNFRYDRNSEFYRLLVGISRLVLNEQLQEEQAGGRQLNNFFDQQDRCDLYERFLLNFYRRHFPELKPAAPHVEWNVDDGFTELLPRMRTDITLYGPEQTLVMDAKFHEAGILKKNTKFENASMKINTGNIYQIYTYVKNLDREHSGRVSGMLLYAQTTEETLPNHHYVIDGNHFYVKTLNLNQRFEKIAADLRHYARIVQEQRIR